MNEQSNQKGKRDVRRERIAKGQCPNCGAEAAPYYLCYKCRFTAKLLNILGRGEKSGGFASERQGRHKLWKIGPKPDAIGTIKWRADPKPGDGRLGPRLRGLRVDVEGTLIEVIRHIGRPCTIEEILAGWGKLRERRTAPLASDLARIIVAQDKRDRKAAKRAAVAAQEQAIQP